MNELYIHIGYPKTATTALQKNVFPYLNGLEYLGRRYKYKNEYQEFIRKMVRSNQIGFEQIKRSDYISGLKLIMLTKKF